jgi:hypothetical protein
VFLQRDEAAIVVQGQLYQMSYSESVASPKLSAICSGGDILGYKEIDNGLSVDEHTWIIAPH